MHGKSSCLLYFLIIDVAGATTICSTGDGFELHDISAHIQSCTVDREIFVRRNFRLLT